MFSLRFTCVDWFVTVGLLLYWLVRACWVVRVGMSLHWLVCVDFFVLVGLLLYWWNWAGGFVLAGSTSEFVIVLVKLGGWVCVGGEYVWVCYCTGGIGRVGFCWREVRVSLTLYWWNWAGVFVLVRSTFEFVSVRVDLWWCVCLLEVMQVVLCWFVIASLYHGVCDECVIKV